MPGAGIAAWRLFHLLLFPFCSSLPVLPCLFDLCLDAFLMRASRLFG